MTRRYTVRKWTRPNGEQRWAYWSTPWQHELGLPPDDDFTTWRGAYLYAHAAATFDRLTDHVPWEDQ